MPKNDVLADAILELAELLQVFAQRMKRSLVRPEVDGTVDLLTRRLKALCENVAES